MDRKEVKRRFDALGFDFPRTEAQLAQFDEAFKDYPHKTDGMKVDPFKIIGNENN